MVLRTGRGGEGRGRRDEVKIIGDGILVGNINNQVEGWVGPGGRGGRLV